MKHTDADRDAAFARYLAESRAIRERATRLTESIHNRGWKLAATVGIPRCGCSLHNASIDDRLTGWCAGNPERLQVAKLASKLVNDWTPSRLGDAIISKLHNRLLSGMGWAPIRVKPVISANSHILFRR